jgi:predicted GNAT superfamily acetyltransferase
MTDTRFEVTVGDEITLRRAESSADYKACQRAQEQAWDIAEPGYLIPIATMVAANLHGGLVLGAFSPGGEAVAMSFAFLARVEECICLYSQLTGVIPAYQSRGLGYRLKQLQREIAHAEGIEEICWAFDPLQAGNAAFNLSRLGAAAVRYVENMYGERTDPLNAGAPTDRLIVRWETAGPPPIVLPAGAARDLPRLIETTAGEREGHAPAVVMPTGELSAPALGEPLLLLEIPHDIGVLRREQPALAERWRSAVNEAFVRAFEASYHAVHFVRDDSTEARRSFYLLERL